MTEANRDAPRIKELIIIRHSILHVNILNLILYFVLYGNSSRVVSIAKARADFLPRALKIGDTYTLSNQSTAFSTPMLIVDNSSESHCPAKQCLETN